MKLEIEGKNLLGFSGGIDSTALFFMLLESQVEFDIAIVDYCKREQSKEEVAYAKELAQKHKKRCYTKELLLDDSNFEANARAARYAFFEEIIRSEGYDNLILAHQLNDALEWFLMQLTKGAGVLELVGMRKIEPRDGYRIIRPLLGVPKNELLEMLNEKNIKYFVDESNSDEKYRRNYFRHNFSDRLISEFKDGIARSLSYLQEDADILASLSQTKQDGELFVIKRSGIERLDIANIDKALKKLGVVASFEQRAQIQNSKDCVISGKVAICYTKEQIFVAPYLKCVMPKEFKEEMRLKKIPPKIRGYLFRRQKW